MMENSIDSLGLSCKTRNCLVRAGIRTIDDLRSKTDAELKRIRNVGASALCEIKTALNKLPGCEYCQQDKEGRITTLPGGRLYISAGPDGMFLKNIRGPLRIKIQYCPICGKKI